MNKKIIILQHNGGRLANQLWSFISIYAYGLEKGYNVENYSFFEYAHYFKNIRPKNLYIKFLFFYPFLFFNTLIRNKYRSKLIFFFRKYYEKYVNYIKRKCFDSIVYAISKVVYLPPTKISEISNKYNLENTNKKKLFFYGWLFRNPTGIIKYQNEIIRHFEPNFQIKRHVSIVINKLKEEYQHIVGVHIRQGDYRFYQKGKYFFNPKKVAFFLQNYIDFFKLDYQKIVFIISSDEKVDLKIFDGLHVVVSKGEPGYDLFTLAATDIIFGSSSFSEWAAYYGNIPYIIYEHAGINWENYLTVKKYQENTNSVLVQELKIT